MNSLERLRNVGISAHIDSGKTTLTERMLFYCGRIHKMRDVRGGDGGATMDSDPIERRRGITITSAATSVGWKDHAINVIDTPGHVDFTVEVERSLRVLDSAVLVLCAVGGVQSQSLTVDRQMRRYRIPRVAFINKLDRTGANPQRVIEQMRDRLGTNAVALQIPMGLEEQFHGVIDLVMMQAVTFAGEHGQHVKREEIPTAHRADAERARQRLLDALSDLDFTIMEELLAGQEPSPQQIRRAIRQATLDQMLTPVLMGSAFKNKGVQEILDSITMYLPSPSEREIVANKQDQESSVSKVSLISDSELPLVAMAFKTVIEPFGQLTFMRIYQGRIERGRSYRNALTGRRIRFGRLVRLHADQRTEIDSADAGDIVGVVGIECVSGDTFVSGEERVVLENIQVAEPVMQLSIAPVNRDDSSKLSKALDRFRREDPTFRVSTDETSGETLIAGMGQLHLDVYVERIRSDYDCPCIVGHSLVAYKTQPTKSVRFDYRLRKQPGGRGQFAHIVGRVEPLPIGSEPNVLFEDHIKGGAIDRQYIPAVQHAFMSSLRCNPLGPYEVLGVKMVLEDGQQHEKDSSELAFRNCTMNAMREEIWPHAGLVLLEPIMKITIDVPTEHQGAVIGHLSRIRGVVNSTEVDHTQCSILAEAPLAELFDYASEIRSLTQGKGSFTMEPLEYRQTPTHVQQSILR